MRGIFEASPFGMCLSFVLLLNFVAIFGIDLKCFRCMVVTIGIGYSVAWLGYWLEEADLVAWHEY
jgi:hypothetical protein